MLMMNISVIMSVMNTIFASISTEDSSVSMHEKECKQTQVEAEVAKQLS
jgi:hypothetical protein